MNASYRRCLLAGLTAVGLTGCRDLGTVAAPTDSALLDRATPGASFEWTMPARFGMDGDGDGLIDYPRTPEEIHPSSWTVDFDACQLAPGRDYVWYVDDRRVASVSSCLYTHEFPAEGTYDVALHVVRVPGPGTWAEHLVTVQDWLVVSFGDSYASGEGVPEVAQAPDAVLVAIDESINHLVVAGQLLAAAQTSLQEAFEEKGLAESILATQQQRRQNFLAACTIEKFKDLLECAEFLVNLPSDTYETASAHFNQLVTNAQERWNSAVTAFQQAQAAFNAAQSAVNNLRQAIEILVGQFQPVKWQPQFANEDWQGEDCHRSANAAPARAARALEESDPRTSVTFLHFACTGARIDMFRGMLRSQVPWANELVGSREIDAVLLSIGGNDAGFANIALGCAVQQPCYLDNPIFDPANLGPFCFLLGVIGLEQQCLDLAGVFPPQSAKRTLERGVAELPPRYEELATQLLPQLAGLLEPHPFPGSPLSPLDPAARVRSGRVYITEYVDMTKDDAQVYCRFDVTDPLGAIPGITPDEMEWLDVIATRSINGAVAAAANTHGWNAVQQIYSAYATHGYCAEERWVVRVHETFLRQGDESGVAHPNVMGHIHNGQAILADVLEDLYPDGIAGVPRAPDQPFLPGPAVANGRPPAR